MDTVLRTKLLVVALTTAFLGVSAVAVAEEDPEDQVEQAVEQADAEATEQQDEELDDPEEQEEEEVDEPEEQEDQADEQEDEPEQQDEQEDELEQQDEEADEPADEPEQQDEEIDEPADEPEQQEDEPVDQPDEQEDEDPWDDVDPDEPEVEEEEVDEDEEEEDEEDEEPFVPTFGAGVETGFFFTGMDRFDSYILEPNDHDTLDVLGAQHVELSIESEVLENLRISMFGGATFTWQQDPSMSGWYVGLEPAYVVGDDEWGMAIGVAGGIGGMGLNVDDEEVRMSLALLRPFVEARRYFTDNAAAYLRVGMNHWWPGNPRSEEMDLDTAPGDRELGTVQLQTGGVYLSAGARFGALQGLMDPEEMEEMEPTEQQQDDDD